MTREELRDYVDEQRTLNNIPYHVYSALIDGIDTLEQEPKTGHWIFVGEENEEEARNGNFRYICSECGYSDVHAKSTKVPYCWHCGVKMESEG